MKIPRRHAADRYPLSSAQHRLWFIDQLQPGNHAYNVGRGIHVRGPLNRAAVDHAFTELIRRHEILRTTYDAVDGVPMQRVEDPRPVRTPVQDLSTPPAAHVQHVRQSVTQEIRRPFDLASDWPIRTRLFQLSPDEHILVVTVHHIAVDSMTIILSELATLYDASARRAESPLAPLPIQYADYALWERQLLTGVYLDRLTDYWRKQLAGASHVLNLPADLPRQRVLGTSGARYYFQMPSVRPDALDRLSRSARTTRFTAWLAAFAVLLMHYSGQDDVLISGPVACRELPELEPLIGCFANTVVFRVDLSQPPTFRDLLGRVTRTVWGTLAHRRLPFHHLVDIARPARNSSRVPLVQANFRVAPPDQLKLADLDVTLLPVESSGSKFELAAQLDENGAGFLDYNTDLFSPERILAIAGDFESVTCRLIANPDVPVDSEMFRPPSGIRPAQAARPSLAAFASSRRSIEKQ
jgi:Condensation domain